MSRDSKTRRKSRRARSQQRQDAALAPAQGPPRVRRDFAAKARRGDAAELRVAFSGVEVPFDPQASDPSSGLAERHEAVVAWDEAGHPTKGSA